MVVEYVDVSGAETAGGATSITVPSPAGNVDDLLVFVLHHDDYSDGEISGSNVPINLTTLHDGSPQKADDSRAGLFYGKETSGSSRNYVFSWATAEEGTGVCLRLSGAHASSPIDGSVIRDLATSNVTTGLTATTYGAMFVSAVTSDSAFYTPVAPQYWTIRAELENISSILLLTRGATTYPFPMKTDEASISNDPTSIGDYQSFGFTVAPAESLAAISGAVYTSGAVPISGAEVQLFKRLSGSQIEHVNNTVSDFTGAYGFTLTNDTDSSFFVYATSGASAIMDATAYNLQPS